MTSNQPGSAANSLLTFFQSLMPSFNPQAANNVRRGQNAAAGEAQEAGAAAAALPDARFNMNQMMERLRDVLVNIENNFPAAAQPNDANHDEGGAGDDSEVYDPNEYD